MQPVAYVQDLRREVRLLEAQVQNLEFSAGQLEDLCAPDGSIQPDVIMRAGDVFAVADSRDEDAQLRTARDATGSPGSELIQEVEGLPTFDAVDSGGRTWIYRDDGHLRHPVIFALSASVAAVILCVVSLVIQSSAQDTDKGCVDCTRGSGKGTAGGPGPY